jgi:hypothetical protein
VVSNILKGCGAFIFRVKQSTGEIGTGLLDPEVEGSTIFKKWGRNPVTHYHIPRYESAAALL